MGRKTRTTKPSPAEFRDRAVQMVIDHLDSCATVTAAVRLRIAGDPDDGPPRHVSEVGRVA